MIEKRDGSSPEDRSSGPAYRSGLKGSYQHRWTSSSEKADFESGLALFLRNHDMSCITPSDVSDATVLKGFLYDLLANGVISYAYDPLDVNYQPDFYTEVFSDTVENYDNHILRGDREAAEEKNKLLLGASIAEDYATFRSYLPVVHGIRMGDVPTEQLRKYFKIHRDTVPMLLMVEDPLKTAIDFYQAKSGVAELPIKETKLRLEETDTLTFILNIIQHFEKVSKALGFLEKDSSLSIDIEKERKRIGSLKMSAIQGIKNPRQSRTEEGLRAAVELEQYELAARLRDELNEIRTSSKKKTSEK